MSGCDISVFTSSEILTKQFSFFAGELQKRPGGHMTSGQVKRVALRRPEDLAALLRKLTPYQALSFGLCAERVARIVAQNMLDKVPSGSTPVIARTAQFLGFKGAGVWMLDVDPPKDGTPPLTREQVLELVAKVCPELAEAPMVICDSASSHIWNRETGKELIGARGLRIYVFVSDATDIPRAGKVLFSRLWLAGHGRIELSATGSMLVRGPIDDAVWQPERLDFAAGAACEAPLEQRRPAPEVRNNDAPPLDTRQALPSLTSKQEGELSRLVQAAKEKVKPESARVRAQWLEKRVDAELSREGMTRETHPREAQAKRDQLAAAALTNVLTDDVVLYPKDMAPVTVAEVLADPDKWDGVRFADPLDPGCYNDDRIALAILKDDDPRIFSHAHGGHVYYLGDSEKSQSVSPSQSPRGETVRHPLKVVNVHEFLALELPERGNVLSPILPQQGVIMVYGPRGIAKTWVALGMAWASAAGGVCIGGWRAERPWKVIYIDGEMPARVLQERLALIMLGAGGDCDPDYFTILTPDIQGDEGMPNLSTQEGRAALEPYIADREVVFIDNLATLSRSGRENEAESWLPMQEWCLDMRRRGKSVVLVHHAGKSGQQRGTSAREDILDTVISLRKSKDYEPNQGAKFEVHLEKARGITGQDAEPFAAELIQAPEGGVTWACVPVQDEREAKVKAMVAEGLSVPDIVDETGLSRATVYRIKKKLEAN